MSFPIIQVPGEIETPALVVDLGRFEANLARMAKALAERGVGLRPHAKTHKSIEVARRQLAAGAVGITTATLSEAEVFAAAQIEDIFVAYPVWAAPAKVARIERLRRSARLLLGVDSVEGARTLGASGVSLEVLVEVDSGDLRTGVASPGDALVVARAAAKAGLTVVGVFTHGGHSYAAPDAAGGAADDEVRALNDAAQALREAGFEVSVLSAGSTPTATLSAREGVTEERPGTYVFGDRQQTMLGSNAPGDVALFVAATVVSTARDHAVLDAGAKALAKDRHPSLDGYGAIPAYPYARIERLYDHHGVVRFDGGPQPRVGDVVTVVPNHVCPVVNLAEELVVVSEGRVVDLWPVDARARSR